MDMEINGEDTDPGAWVDGVTVGDMELDMVMDIVEDMVADMAVDTVVDMEDMVETGMVVIGTKGELMNRT